MHFLLLLLCIPKNTSPKKYLGNLKTLNSNLLTCFTVVKSIQGIEYQVCFMTDNLHLTGTVKSRCSLNLSTYQPQAILVLDPCHVQVQALAFVEGPFYFAAEVPGYVGWHWVRRNSLAHSEVETEN